MRPLTMALALLLAGCATPDESGMDEQAGMGDEGMLGMGVQSDVLGSVRLDSLPEGQLRWVGTKVQGEVEHAHAPAFLYADEGEVALVVEGEEETIPLGEARFIPGNVTHTHPRGSAVLEVQLSPQVWNNTTQSARVFTSPALEGIPQPPVEAKFVRVELPPEAMTSVHQHPGPEYIYVTKGAFEYQAGGEEPVTLESGDDRALPPMTPVQKRNPSGAEAAFLSWFLVEPGEPFVQEAAFPSPSG